MASKIHKILILRFSSLGDIVMTTPMIRALRKTYPNAQIDMVVRSDFADLIRDNPHLTNAITLNRGSGMAGLWKLLIQLNRQHYDVIYDAHRSLRTLFLMPFLKARRKFYFQKHYIKRSLALTFKLRLLKGMPRTLERTIQPLLPLGVMYDGGGPELVVSKTSHQSAIEKASLPSLPKNALRIALIPSAQWPGKRWPLSHFRTLMETLVTQTPHQLVLLGGKEDSFCNELAADLPTDRVVNLQGKLSIAESGAILSTCDFAVANDTGLMHMNDALGKPCVLFLGPTSGELGCLPFHPASIVLERSLWCRPCSKNGQAPCIRMSRKCLKDISAESAFQATRQLASKLQR